MSDLRLFQRQGVWHVRGTVKIPGREIGVRVRQSAGTTRLREAEVYRDRLRQEVIDRETLGPAHALTFSDCVLIYLAGGKDGEKKHLKPIHDHFGKMRVRDISAEAVASFALDNYGHLAPASVRRFFYTPFNAALRAGCKANDIAPRSFEAPKVTRTLMENAPESWFPLFFKAAHFRIAVAVLFLTTTGARVSEACRLKVEDCDFANLRALLRRTKNGKPRMVPLTETLVLAMQRLIDVDGSQSDALVFGYSSRWSVNQAVERICSREKIKYYSSHQLGRHAFAARFLNTGGDIKGLKDAGGWSSIQIVDEAYGHLEEKAVNALVRDKGSEVAKQMADTPLTHTDHRHRKRAGVALENKRKMARENKLLLASRMVGGTGIEPVTPTMSRAASEPDKAKETPENKALDASCDAGTCVEHEGNDA